MATRPERVEIGNLETGRSLSALYNPRKVEETIGANFQRLTIPGFSHQLLQFVHTENLVVSFDLGFDALSTNVESPDKAVDMRNFLMSLLYQRRGAQDVAGGAPPLVLLFWPNLYSLVCQVTKLKTSFELFETSMGPILFTMSLSLEENPQGRIFSEDVAETGTIRSGQ